MPESEEQTKLLNRRIFFLTLIVAFATVCSLMMSVFTVQDKYAGFGLGIVIIFLILIPISGYLSQIMVK
jgi:cell division protein FtsW (lipid II flippase)